MDKENYTRTFGRCHREFEMNQVGARTLPGVLFIVEMWYSGRKCDNILREPRGHCLNGVKSGSYRGWISQKDMAFVDHGLGSLVKMLMVEKTNEVSVILVRQSSVSVSFAFTHVFPDLYNTYWVWLGKSTKGADFNFPFIAR